MLGLKFLEIFCAFYERLKGFRTQKIIGKCTTRFFFRNGVLVDISPLQILPHKETNPANVVKLARNFIVLRTVGLLARGLDTVILT